MLIVSQMRIYNGWIIYFLEITEERPMYLPVIIKFLMRAPWYSNGYIVHFGLAMGIKAHGLIYGVELPIGTARLYITPS